MWVLALESSTEWCSAAVGDGRRWHAREERVGSTHSERLLPLVRAVLAEAELALGGLDGIAYGAGPGSFTGIRIGCGVAQGLAFGTDLPLVAVSTLEALAEDARRAHGWQRVLACIDARMREVYAAAYAADGAAWRTLMEPVAAKPEDLALPPDGEGVCGAGNGFAAYPSLAARLGVTAADPDRRATARTVGALALPRLAAGETLSAATALPTYVRHRVALTTAERDAGRRLQGGVNRP